MQKVVKYSHILFQNLVRHEFWKIQILDSNFFYVCLYQSKAENNVCTKFIIYSDLTNQIGHIKYECNVKCPRQVGFDNVAFIQKRVLNAVQIQMVHI